MNALADSLSLSLRIVVAASSERMLSELGFKVGLLISVRIRILYLFACIFTLTACISLLCVVHRVFPELGEAASAKASWTED